MTITTTYEKLFDYALTAQRWIAKDAANKNTKLGYAIVNKMEPRVKKAAEGFNVRIEDLNIDHASVDEKGVLLIGEKGEFRYTKEELKKRNTAQRALQQETCEIEVYFATALPEDLTEQEIENFTGFVIKEGTAAAATE